MDEQVMFFCSRALLAQDTVPVCVCGHRLEGVVVVVVVVVAGNYY
jgi:hypothetical protein